MVVLEFRHCLSCDFSLSASFRCLVLPVTFRGEHHRFVFSATSPPTHSFKFMSSRSDEADGDVSSSSSSYKTQTENGVAPVRTVSSRSNIIRSTLRRILRRHELLRRVDGGDKEEEENAEEEEDHGEDEDEEEAEEKAPKLPPAMTSTAAARSPARAFEFLVSPRSQLARRSANKGRGPNVANAANAANAAYLSANTSSNDYGPPALPAAAAGDGGGPSVSDAEGKAPLALVSDFSQALEEKNWVRERSTLSLRVLLRGEPMPWCHS